MGKKSSDGMIDGGLDKIATCITYTICAGEPTSQADIAAKALASKIVSAGDFTKANGDTSGRKVTIAQQTSLNITAGGTADHVAIDDGVDFEITTCTSQALVSGGTVTGPAFDIEIADPV